MMAKESSKNPKDFMGHPVNSFLMIQLLTKGLDSFINSTKFIEESEGIQQKLNLNDN